MSTCTVITVEARGINNLVTITITITGNMYKHKTCIFIVKYSSYKACIVLIR